MIGSNLSTSIYILHPIWIDFLLRAVNRWIGNDSVREILAYGYPFFIFLISGISAWLLHIVSKRLKNHLHTT
ncbi:MAG: hypothetical protein IJD81_01500 [Oscillospiraceae bacterium]|nr:hypothetical protein [Oscillospiraceae bacterium]